LRQRAHPDDGGIGMNRSPPRPFHYFALDQWRVSTNDKAQLKVMSKSLKVLVPATRFEHVTP
jgi:hypothetical protein